MSHRSEVRAHSRPSTITTRAIGLVDSPTMSLPASLLAVAESHGCFSGCYSREIAVTLAVDPAAPTVTSYDVSCPDCLAFRLGVLTSLLPPNYTSYQLAADLSAHVHAFRGYAWAISGYHVNLSGGSWLTAASFGNGVLLADSSRNRNGVSDLDVLVEAFKAKLITPEDPAMIDPQLYSAETVYVELSAPFGAVRSKQDILASKQCSRTPQPGFHRVTLLEFQPMIAAAVQTARAARAGPIAQAAWAARTAPAASATQAAPVVQAAAAPVVAAAPVTPVAGAVGAPRQLALGERCPVCNAVVMRRQLLTEHFDGCLC